MFMNSDKTRLLALQTAQNVCIRFIIGNTWKTYYYIKQHAKALTVHDYEYAHMSTMTAEPKNAVPIRAL